MGEPKDPEHDGLATDIQRLVAAARAADALAETKRRSVARAASGPPPPVPPVKTSKPAPAADTAEAGGASRMVTPRAAVPRPTVPRPTPRAPVDPTSDDDPSRER